MKASDRSGASAGFSAHDSVDSGIINGVNGDSRNVREQIVAELAGAPESLSADMLARRFGVHPNTVRFHLRNLEKDGVVEHCAEDVSVRGRPRVLYRATERAFGSGPTNDALLARVLVSAFAQEHGSDVGEAARLAGRRWGSDNPKTEGASKEDQFSGLLNALSSWGFAPSVVGNNAKNGKKNSVRVIALNRCAFAEIAARHGDVICPLHEGMVAAQLAASGGAWRVNSLVPLGKSGQCTLTCAVNNSDE